MYSLLLRQDELALDHQGFELSFCEKAGGSSLGLVHLGSMRVHVLGCCFECFAHSLAVSGKV